MQQISLRKAAAHDKDFIWEMRQLTMKEYVANAFGWNDDHEYAYAMDKFEHIEIVESNGEKIGMMKSSEDDTAIHLHQIQVKPTWANKGIGSWLIRNLISTGKEKNKNIELHVLKTNPVKKLYDRLGFVVVADEPHKYLMRYTVLPM